MAKAIRQINKSIPTEEELQLQAISDIMKALGENRDAILTSIDILKNLHDIGVLREPFKDWWNNGLMLRRLLLSKSIKPAYSSYD